MASKKAYYFAAFIGSIVGGFIPSLWGASVFSVTSLIFSGLGGIIAILIVMKF